MITLDDLAAAVKSRLDAAPAVANALPGGTYFDRGPDQPAGAYAVFTLEREGETEWFSDGSYLQGYVLRVACYTCQGRGDPAAAQLALAAALNPQPVPWATLRAGVVMSCLPRGYDGKHAPDLREGKDVFAAAGQWALIVDGNRTP